MDSGSWILGFAFWSFDFGFWILNFGVWILFDLVMFGGFFPGSGCGWTTTIATKVDFVGFMVEGRRIVVGLIYVFYGHLCS